MEVEGKKTKDKTRVLAHSRRQRENDTFTDIAQSLPIQENAKDLDKASILRVAIHYLKLRDVVNGGEPPNGDYELEEEDTAPTKTGPSITEFLPNFSKDVLQALDGFLLIISRDGRILYVSESIANYLGLRQVDVIGVHAQDIIHPQDFGEVATIFQTQGHDTQQVFDTKDPLRRNFVVRMRCAFTPSVRSITRCSNFKPIYCSAYLKFAQTGPTQGQFMGIVALCKLASIARIKEMCVGAFFKTKHSLDLSYMGIDTRIRWILGYDPTEMMGLKAYQYFHPGDLTATSSCHMNLLSKGESHSPCYRFMSRWGDWVWVRSKSYMVFNPVSQLPEAIFIYTWIVRIAEEDDRMKAIQEGKPADHLKKYSTFSSSVSTHGGTLDIAALAQPDGPVIDTSKPVEAQIKPETPASPPTTSPTVADTPVAPVIQPLTIPKVVQQALWTGITTPPDSAMNEYPPNVSPFTSCSHASVASLERCSPERQSVIQGAEVMDNAGLYDMPQTSTSFMPSPPYTPYNLSPTKHVPFDPMTSTHVSDGNRSATGSPYSNYPSNLPSPASSFRRSISPSDTSADGQFGSPTSSHHSPPYCTTSPPRPYQEEINVSGSRQPNQFPVQMQATVFATSTPVVDPRTLAGYDATNLTELQFLEEGPSAGPNSASRQRVQRHTVIHQGSYVDQARARYNKVANAVPGGYTNARNPNDREASESISKWSQWLKESAPSPVC